MSISEITIEHNPDKTTLQQLSIFNWPIWEKEESVFPWTYDKRETCYFLDGEVVVTPDGGEPVEMGVGDLVTFPKGMSCTWEIKLAVSKHYDFD